MDNTLRGAQRRLPLAGKLSLGAAWKVACGWGLHPLGSPAFARRIEMLGLTRITSQARGTIHEQRRRASVTFERDATLTTTQPGLEVAIMVTEESTPVEILRAVALSLRQQAEIQDRNESEVFSMAASAVEHAIDQLMQTRGEKICRETS